MYAYVLQNIAEIKRNRENIKVFKHYTRQLMLTQCMHIFILSRGNDFTNIDFFLKKKKS